MEGLSHPPADPWSRWLNTTRHGNSAIQRDANTSAVARYIAHLLSAAQPQPGEILADLGTGDGAVAFAAIAATGPGLTAIFTDISAALLSQARDHAAVMKLLPQCRFIQCPASHLPIADASTDIVTSRAALAYEPEKPSAFQEIFRILKPSGRLAIAEPIFQDDAFAATALTIILAARPAHHPEKLLPLIQRWKAAQFPSTEAAIAATPITNFTERDLVRFAAKAGFTEIHLQLHIDMTATSPPLPWEVFTATSPHPLAPSLAEILEQQFTCEERHIFKTAFQPIIETGRLAQTSRIAYLTAVKP
jgi:ubiquinone/menaquinone biosynthesis C-methylase UbiE